MLNGALKVGIGEVKMNNVASKRWVKKCVMLGVKVHLRGTGVR